MLAPTDGRRADAGAVALGALHAADNWDAAHCTVRTREKRRWRTACQRGGGGVRARASLPAQAHGRPRSVQAPNLGMLSSLYCESLKLAHRVVSRREQLGSYGGEAESFVLEQLPGFDLKSLGNPGDIVD